MGRPIGRSGQRRHQVPTSLLKAEIEDLDKLVMAGVYETRSAAIRKYVQQGLAQDKSKYRHDVMA